MKVLVLLSGGIDSTTCLAMAIENMVLNRLSLSVHFTDKNITKNCKLPEILQTTIGWN